MPASPIFGPSEVDQSPGSVSLPTEPGTVDPYWSDWFRRNAQNAQSRSNPYQTGNQDQARLQQQQVIQDLQRAARGDPNSLAQQQLAQGYGDARSQQSSLGSTMRGQSAGAAMRGISAGQQGIQRGYAGDQQLLQIQEQQAAQAMLAQLLAQQHGQDISQAQGMAQGALGAQGLDDNMRQFYTQSGIGADVAANQIAQERARAKLGFDLESQNLNNILNQRLVGMAQGATGTLASMPWGAPKGSGGYRQVDGQNSIVPDWDK